MLWMIRGLIKPRLQYRKQFDAIFNSQFFKQDDDQVIQQLRSDIQQVWNKIKNNCLQAYKNKGIDQNITNLIKFQREFNRLANIKKQSK